MKKIIRRIFLELYHWQNNNWGRSSSPQLTSLLILSALQFLNVLAILMISESISSVNMSVFFNDHLVFSVIILVALLLGDYSIVKPIDLTIKENPLTGRRITWIYVLATILLLAGCVAWKIYRNERGA